MKASSILITNLKSFEGCRLTAYKDSVGVPTIGYGHTAGVKMGMKITQEQADEFLLQDLAIFEKYVNTIKGVKTQGQFDALVDFAFNLGIDRLKKSTLLMFVNAGCPLPDIQAQFMRWNKAGGKVLPGLTKRRRWEADRFAAAL